MKPSEVLAKAADLIEPEGRWTRGALARNERRRDVKQKWHLATCFCASGAIGAVANDDAQWTEAFGYLSAVTLRLSGDDVITWNDDLARTQAEVVKALRDASELAKAEGK